MTRQIVVDIVGDSSKFTKATDNATKTGGRFSKQAVKGFGLGVGLGVFSLAESAVSSFVGALGDMQQAYKDDEVSQAKLKTALKNNVPAWDGSTAAIEDYASAQAKLGFQDDEIRDSIGQLIGITHDQTKAMELNSLAQDLARSKGVDLATATDIVTKAAQGNGKALKALGIDTQGATDAAGYLAAIHQNTLGAALDYSTTKQGLADAAAVKNAESMEKIGSVVDKVASAVLPVAAEAFSQVADVILSVGEAVAPIVQDLVRELTPAFKTVVSFLTGTLIPIVTKIVQTVMPPMGAIIKTVAGLYVSWTQTLIGTIVNIVNAVKGPIGTIVSIITGIGTAIVGVAKTVSDSITKIVGFFGGIGTKISSATRGMWDGIFNAFKGVINTIIRGWNSLKFSLPSIDLGPLGHVGGFTIGTPNIPYLHAGGIVPGTPGSDVPTILQAGEQVIARKDVGGRAVHIHFEGPVIASGPDIDRLANLIAQRIRLSGA